MENSIDDLAMELKIQDKGLNAPRIAPQQLLDVIVKEQYHVFEGTQFTVCLLTLKNGFNVEGVSACASPENFDADIGKEIAFKDAMRKIWGLEGYLLKQKLYEDKSNA